MFESVLYQLLAGYLGHYVKDINREHFRLGLWSGEAFLENVEVRLEAFDYLQLPFSIKQGFVGKLRLQVPWSRLGWDPILITLEDVTLLAGPHEESEYAADASERRALAAKKAGLAAAEIAKLSQRVSEDKSGETFLSYLSAKIIDNVQVTVTQVHIQYVDGITDPERVFSFGITLRSLSISTTDGRDHPVLPSMSAAVKGGGNPVFKLVEIKELAVYWNSDKGQVPSSQSSLSGDGNIRRLFAVEGELVYLLRPTNASLRLTVDKKATLEGSGPHYSVAVQVHGLALALEDRQLIQMVLLMDVLSMSRLRERYARFRPQISETNRAGFGWQRRLWVFAIQAVLSDVRKHLRGSSWSYFSWRSGLQKRYVSLYKEKLGALQRNQQSGDQKWAELEEMEREFEMEEILYFRSLAENQLLSSSGVFITAPCESECHYARSDQSEGGVQQLEIQPSQQALSQQRGWLNWLSLGLLGAAESIDAAVCPDEIIKIIVIAGIVDRTSSWLDDLCEAADFNPTTVIDSGKSLKGQCSLILSVHVHEAHGSLVDSCTKKEIVNMFVGGTSVTASLWQESSTISIIIPTIDLCAPFSQFSHVLYPKATNIGPGSSTIIINADDGANTGNRYLSSDNFLSQALAYPEGIAANPTEQMEFLLKLEVEINKETQDFEITLNVTVQPVEFLYSPPLVDQILEFFCRPASLYTRHEVLVSGLETLESIAGHTRAKAEFAFATRRRVGWHLDIQKPTFLFPMVNTGADGMLLILSWESLLVASAELRSTASSSMEMAAAERLWAGIGSTRCYERLEVCCVGVQVLLVAQTSNLLGRSSQDASLESQVVECFDFQVAVCCLPSDPTKMIRLKVSGEILSLRLHLSSKKCIAVKAVLTQFMDSVKKVRSQQYDSVEDEFANAGVAGVSSSKLSDIDMEARSKLETQSSCDLSEVSEIRQSTRTDHKAAALELKLNMNVLVMQLCTDEQSGPVQHITVLAQLQDMSIRYTRWDLEEEVQLIISGIDIEDNNELAGSPLSLLRSYSDSPSYNSSCFHSIWNKKLSSFNINEPEKSRLDVSLQGMECHCHPKIMMAISSFIAAVMKSTKPSLSAERGIYNLNECPGRLSQASGVQVSSAGVMMRERLLIDGGLVLGVQMKDSTFHLYDPGGIIASLVVVDGNATVFFTRSTGDVLKVVVVVKEVRLKGPQWASGNIGGDPFAKYLQRPVTTLNLTIRTSEKSTTFSGLQYGVLELDIAIQNARCILLNDYFALLIGYCLNSEWKSSIKKENSSGSHTGGSILGTRKTICLYKVEVSDSVLFFPQDCGLEEYIELNISKLSFCFTPAGLARIESDTSDSVCCYSFSERLSISDFVCMEWQETALTLHGFHQYLDCACGDQLRLVERIDGQMTLKLPTSGAVAEAARVGSSIATPITVEVNLSVLYVNLAGYASRKGAELLKVYQKELSSIPWKYRVYAAVGFHLGFKDRSPFNHLKPPPAADTQINFLSRISQLTLLVKAPKEPSLDVARLQAESLGVSIVLSHGVIDSLKVELLSLNLISGPSRKVLLNVSAGDGNHEGNESPEKVILLLLIENRQLHVALPCTKVWLHLGAWLDVISALVCGGTSPTSVAIIPFEKGPVSQGQLDAALCHSNLRLGSAEAEILRLQQDLLNQTGGVKFECTLNPSAQPLQLRDSLTWPVQVKVGVLNVVFILPDYVEETKLHHLADGGEWKQSTSHLLGTRYIGRTGVGIEKGIANTDRDKNDQEKQNGKRDIGKQILFSLLIRIDEIQANHEGLCTLKACIMQAEAVVEENFGGEQSFHMRFLHATDIGISGQISLEESRLKMVTFTLEVDTVDAWCSYNILQFLNKFQFERILSRSSSSVMDICCSVGICVQRCSLLLSDSRWSCNAPIVEILLGTIAFQVLWEGLDIEASLSSEVEVNYHNIQKVAWEPLVEPWSVCCKISRAHDSSTTSSRAFRTKVEVTSSASLNINVTEAFLQAISRAVDMFNDSWKEESVSDVSADMKIRDSQSAESSSMRRYAPYWLQNDTGIPVSYWLCGASKAKEIDENAKTSSFSSVRGAWGSTSGAVVQPGCSVPLYVEEGPDEVLSRRRAGHSTDGYNPRKIFDMHLVHRMICVQLEGTARPSVPMSIDLVGCISFEAVFSDGDSGDGSSSSRLSRGSFQEIENERGGSFSAPVVFEVTVQRYSKLVRLCSMVSIVNTTSVALELRFDIPFLISPKVMDPILPGHVMALPVHLAETGRMRWRPCGNNHLWSEVQVLSNLLQLAESRVGFHRPVVCYPFHPSNIAFRCCMAVENHPIPAAEAIAARKGKGKRRDMMDRNTVTTNLGLRISSASDDIKGCVFWDIFLKAPLVVKNGLPCSLAITIETGAGGVINVSAPEGDSSFVYDIDTAHDLTLTFLAPTYMPSCAKVASAASLFTEIGRNTGQDMRVTFAQVLNFKAETVTHASVTVEMEITVDLVSGARELCMSAPFWLLNCSHLNLAVMDGDVDLYSGKEQLIGGILHSDDEKVEEISLNSPGSRSWPSLATGLQVSVEGPQPGASTRLVRRQARFSSHLDRISGSSQSFIFLEQDIHSAEHGEGCRDNVENLNSVKQECYKENGDNQMCMYSPTQGTDTSELHLRARVVRSHPLDVAKESGEVLWSRPFLLEPQGSTTAVSIPEPEGNGAFVVAVVSAPALGSCAGKTKTITFRPRFLLANVSKQVLCYKQRGTDKFQRLERGKRSQLHWHDVNREFLVSMRIDEHGWDWSGGFAPDQLGDTQVKVRNHTTGEIHMLRVEVTNMLASAGREQGAHRPAGGSLGTSLILLSDDESAFMPYRIENFTLERLRFHQQKCEKIENMLQPYSSCSYAWDEPCRPHRLVVEVPGAGVLGTFGLDEVKEYPAVTLPAAAEKVERRWLVHVHAEGPVRVLSIVDAMVHTARDLSGVDGTSSRDQLQEAGEKLEANSDVFEELVIKLSFLGISVIDSCPQEVVYACAKGLRLQLLQGQHHQIMKFEVAWFQVDNQLRYAVYPVMLSLPKSSSNNATISQVVGTDIAAMEYQITGEDAALAVSVAKWCNQTGSVDCFQYITMRVDPLRLELEERLVSCLVFFMQRTSWSASTADSNISAALHSQPWSVLHGSRLYGVSVEPFTTYPWKYQMEQIPTANVVRFTKLVNRLEAYRCWAAAVAVEPITWQSQKLFLFAKERRKAYVEMLQVAPIVLSVSFSSEPWLSDDVRGPATRSLLWITGTLLQRQVRALADVEGAPVHLRQLQLAHPFASWDVIRGMITRHYTRQLLQEIYKVLGSADVFGNPVGFVRSMASGMREFVSAPTRSTVQTPTELVRGFIQGSRSLFMNTVFAFSNAATRMSRAARKGVAMFTMDSEYDLAFGRLAQMDGSQEISVLNEFLESLTALLQAPIRGAERHGLPGMLSGVALGAVGVVARPVAGILEVAGLTAQSIRNRSRPAQWHATRVRLPRHVNDYSPLLLYSWERAIGQEVLLEAEGGRFKNEVYFTCKPLVQKGKFLILTESKILRVSTATLAAVASNATYEPKWCLELEGEIDDILHIDHIASEVNVLLGPPMRPLVRPQHHAGGSSKYTMRFTPFAHETFELMTQIAANEFLAMVRLLEEQHRRARSKLLLAASASLSCPDFLDLDKFF